MAKEEKTPDTPTAQPPTKQELIAVSAYKRDNGRPRRWKDPQEIIDLAIQYYEIARERDEPLTITGLSAWMGTTRERLNDYCNGNLIDQVEGDSERFRAALKHVKHVAEAAAERQGFSMRNPAFAIFALKNYGWRDVTTVESKHTEVHEVGEETKRLLDGYIRQLASAQMGSQVIDVTPTDGQSGADLLPVPIKAVDNSDAESK